MKMTPFKRLTTWLSKKTRSSSKKVDQVNIHTDSLSDTSSEGSGSDSMIMHKKQLVLDLDETLFHAQTTKDSRHNHAVKFDYYGKEMQYYVAVRPGLFEFLEEMQKYYVLNVFTCSDISYADAILTKIGAKNYFKRIFARANCKRNQDKELSKDLSVLGVERSEIILIDDLTRHIKENSLNGLQIAQYLGEKKDKELKKYTAFLKKLAFCADVRSVSEKYELFKAGKPLITEYDLILKETPITSVKLEVEISAAKISTDESEQEEDDKILEYTSSTVEGIPHSILELKYPTMFLQKAVAVQA